MPTVVIAYNEFPDIEIEQNVLSAIGATVRHVRNLSTPEALAAAVEADALMVSIQQVTADLIDKMTKCRIISRAGSGLDAIDLEGAGRHGIVVTNVPDYSVDEVSTHAITLLLALARRLPQLLDSTRRGEWDAQFVRPYPRFKGQTLGLFGFGRIAQATAAKGQGLGLRVIAYDPYVKEGDIEAAGAEAVDWDTLLKTADYISLHAPLNDSTNLIINSETLALMKPSVFLINTARGGLIDEEALLMAARNKQIAGAALDVLTVEPPPPDHPLLHEERVWITPHIAWYSEAATKEVRTKASEEIVRVFRGERPHYQVNKIIQ